jgi:hypothetical protein
VVPPARKFAVRFLLARFNACAIPLAEAAPAPFIVDFVIVREKNLSLGGLARLLNCAHLD